MICFDETSNAFYAFRAHRIGISNNKNISTQKSFLDLLFAFGHKTRGKKEK